MYNDLIEHFPTVLALLALAFGAAVFLFWHYFARMEKKLDKMCDSLGNVVTRNECNNRHADLLRFVDAILGVTNCKTCRGDKNEQV